MARIGRLPGFLFAFACVACGAESSVDGDTPAVDARVVAEATLGPVRGSVRMTPAEPRFGDRVRLEFDVTADAGVELDAPEFGVRLGHFRIRDRKDTSQLARGRITVAIDAEAERTGTNVLRLPPVSFRVTAGEGAGTERQLVLEPASIEIAGLTPDQTPDLADLGAPLPPVGLPLDRDAGRALWIAGGLALVALAVGLVWWRRRRRVTVDVAPPIDPSREAEQAFAALLADGLPDAAGCAEFYVRLTGIVRRFVERTTGVHAEEQTTEEFLRAMEGNPAFGAERQRELGVFLAAADMVKFAAQVPSAAEILAAVGAARACCGLAPQVTEVAA